MNIKRQILYGLLFLFGLSVLISGLAALSARKLAIDSEAILKDNFNTLLYTKSMLIALDGIDSKQPEGYTMFEQALQKQRGNITEKGEKELTELVTMEFQTLKARFDPQTSRSCRQLIYSIMELNMRAITWRNDNAQANAHKIYYLMIISGIIFLVVAMPFIVKFPSYIALPVMQRDQDKTHLIATVSHEMKTPISSIKLSTKLLADERIGSLNKEQKDLVNNIKEDAERILKIASEVLNMAQVESGKIQLNMEPSHPEDIVNYAVEATKAQAEQKGVSIKTVFDDDLPTVDADPEKTVWVMSNLLSNAIKYSPSNSIIVVQAGRKHEMVIFSVLDVGKGIESEFLNKVFERYFQVPGSESSGTGLGLSICKEFIEAQGGKIWVESGDGSGSKFSFELKQNILNDLLS